MRVLVNTFGRDPEQIFAGKESIQVNCPRCAGSFVLTPALLADALDLLDASEG